MHTNITNLPQAQFDCNRDVAGQTHDPWPILFCDYPIAIVQTNCFGPEITEVLYEGLQKGQCPDGVVGKEWKLTNQVRHSFSGNAQSFEWL